MGRQEAGQDRLKWSIHSLCLGESESDRQICKEKQEGKENFFNPYESFHLKLTYNSVAGKLTYSSERKKRKKINI